MLIFLTMLVSILGFSTYLVLRIALLPLLPNYSFLAYLHFSLYAIATIFFIFTILSRANPNLRRYILAEKISAIFFTFLGFHSLIFLFSTIFALGYIFVPFDYPLGLPILFFSYLVSLMGFLVAKQGPKIIYKKISLSKNTGKYLRIAQISDLHIGSNINKNYVKKVVSNTNEQKPDCIFLTGDIGDGDLIAHNDSILELAKLSANHGIFYVTGNHEYYWAANDWCNAFANLGMHVLKNTKFTLVWNKIEINIFGFDAIAKLDHVFKDITIAIAHYPSRANEALNMGAKLFFAGHTHGGQFWPWSWAIHGFHKYAVGQYNIKGMHAYIHSGTGYWGPPLRLGRRAEILIMDIEF